MTLDVLLKLSGSKSLSLAHTPLAALTRTRAGSIGSLSNRSATPSAIAGSDTVRCSMAAAVSVCAFIGALSDSGQMRKAISG